MERGCDPGTKAVQDIVTIGAGRIPRCPKAYLAEDAREAIQSFEDFKWLKQYSIMPEHGGKGDQSPRYVRAMNIIEAEIGKMESEESNGQ